MQMHALYRTSPNRSKSTICLSELVCSLKFLTRIDGTPSLTGITASVPKVKLKGVFLYSDPWYRPIHAKHMMKLIGL